jgi:succinate dehydrogenase / fumarate reductase flavoprotein subunit
MYQQFKELADVDITAEPMEIGPTCHYFMGGVRVEAETAASTVPGLYAAGEVAGGMHGANRLGGNSLSDLLVFGRRAGLAAAQHALGRDSAPEIDAVQVDAATSHALAAFGRDEGENPYAIQQDLQDCMQRLVGIIRREDELKEAQKELAALKERAKRVKVEGHRQYNPGWHLALDLDPLLTLSECLTMGALERTESRGGHTREDYPRTDDELGKVNMVISRREDELSIRAEPLPQMPDELEALLGDPH